MRNLAATMVAVVGLLAGFISSSGAYVRPGRVELVSVASDGSQAEWPPTGVLPAPRGGYFHNDISAKGRYVVFLSPASNLSPDDGNPLVRDVFLRDRKRRTTELLSISSLGSAGSVNGCPTPLPAGVHGSSNASVSANGRFVSFVSCYADLVPGDTNLGADIFLRDRKTGHTELASVSSDGTPAECDLTKYNSNGCNWTWTGALDDKGRLVSFNSNASNLVRGDTNDAFDTFVHDRVTGKTERVSVSSHGTQKEEPTQCSNGYCSAGAASISADGRYVAFYSNANNLVDGDTNESHNPGDIFVHDRRRNQTERVNLASDGTQQDCRPCYLGWPSVNDGSRVAISGGGRYIAWADIWDGLVPNDTNHLDGGIDVFVHDRRTHRTERVSVTSAGEEGKNASGVGVSISDNGRYVAFGSDAGLVPDDKDRSATCLPSGLFCTSDTDVYVYDRVMGTAELITRDQRHENTSETSCARAQADCHPWNSSITSVSRDGRYIAFGFPYGGLTKDDDNNLPDVFVRERGRGLGSLGPLRFGSSRASEFRSHSSSELIARLRDPDGDAVIRNGPDAEVIHALIAYRPQLRDLFVKIDLERISGPRGTGLAGDPAMLYGIRFTVDGVSFEVRMAKLGPAASHADLFGLFRCDPDCSEIATLKGGYGTVGESVVAAVPLAEIGLNEGGEIAEVTAFSSLGSYLVGPGRILDEATID